MGLHGGIEANLVAVGSARRLRGHPIHADTLQHWTELLHQASRQLARAPASVTETIKQLMADLRLSSRAALVERFRRPEAAPNSSQRRQLAVPLRDNRYA
jgi:hypothetical protein